MSKLYGEEHRALQDRFDTRGMADRLEAVIVKERLDDQARHFLASRDMFFLATVDDRGRPTTSYKGGAEGFVTVIDDRTIAFPSYDGNGMYFSMGNIAGHAEVGLLFIDFEKPDRLRLQGRASVVVDDPLLARYPGAELIVRVALEQVWGNCPRYIHRYRKLYPSRSLPASDGEAPLADWKRLEMVQDVLPSRDRSRVEAAGGSLSVGEYVDKLEHDQREDRS